MNLFTFSAALGWSDEEALPRMRALRLTERCPRCDGRGFVGMESGPDAICFRCRGEGDALPKLTLELCRAVAARVIAGDLRPYFAKKRREAEAAVENRRLLATCKDLSGELVRVLPPEHPSHVRAVELSRGEGSVFEVEGKIVRKQIDPETASVLLTSLRQKLLELVPREKAG